MRKKTIIEKQIERVAREGLRITERVIHNVVYGRDESNPEGYTTDELDAVVKSPPPAPNIQGKDFQDLLLGIANGVNEINANTRPHKPPRGKYNVTQAEAARILGRSARTIKNWEASRNTPEGYSRETRRTLETFTAWARDWEAAQKSKLNTKKAMRYADEHGYTFGTRRR